MKKFMMILAILCAAMTANAQEQGKGYRGFAEVGYGIGVGDYNFGRFSVETSHGYQICHYLYVGGGLGFQFSQKATYGDKAMPLDQRDSKVDIPVFANIHSQFLKSKVSPFVDLKAGAYVNNGGGAYINASAGVRIATTSRQAVNISVGYGFQQLEFETFDHFNNKWDMSYTRSPRRLDTEAVTIKVGYEF